MTNCSQLREKASVNKKTEKYAKFIYIALYLETPERLARDLRKQQKLNFSGVKLIKKFFLGGLFTLKSNDCGKI